MAGDDYTFRSADRRTVEPLTVTGGWVVAEHRWYRDEDGWQCDYDELHPRIVYATEDECKQAIKEMP